MKIIIRDIEEKDFDFVLTLNEKNVEVLSPMDEERLKFFIEKGDLVKIVEVCGLDCESSSSDVAEVVVPAAFFIVLREGISEYKSENYIWFSNAYSRFLYIDRIVIDEKCRGKGIGRGIYEYVFCRGRDTDVSTVTAEIDTIPYNGASLGFHRTMGFEEIAEQLIRGGTVKVSLQVRDLLSE